MGFYAVRFVKLKNASSKLINYCIAINRLDCKRLAEQILAERLTSVNGIGAVGDSRNFLLERLLQTNKTKQRRSATWSAK